MRYDTVLKELFQQAPQRLLELMTGDTAQEMLTVEYPSVRLRKPDLVVRLAGGGIFHLELQSGSQDDMLWRMLEYYILIYRQFGQPPTQRVLYVGDAVWKMTETLDLLNLSFRCPFTDIRELDCRVLLNSPQFEDRLLAVLCRQEDPRRTLRSVLETVTRLPDKARQDALEKLLVLVGLRRLETVLKQEVQAMALVVDISQNEFFKEAFHKGMQQGIQQGMQQGMQQGTHKGEEEMLLRLLRRRFGELPAVITERVRQADSETLLNWSERVLNAASLEAVFDEEG